MPYDWKTELSDIYARHADYCSRREGGICICGPMGYRAAFADPSTGRREVSPDFPDIASAQAWLHDQQSAAGNGRRQDQGVPPPDSQQRAAAPATIEVSAAIEEFIGAAERGQVALPNGASSTFESVGALRSALSYVDFELGSMSLADVRRTHIRNLVDDLHAAGVPEWRVAGVVDGLQSLYAYAIQRGLVHYSPVVELGSTASQTQTPWAAAPGRPNSDPYAAPQPTAAPEGTPPYGDADSGAYQRPPPPAPGPWAPPSGPQTAGPWTPPNGTQAYGPGTPPQGTPVPGPWTPVNDAQIPWTQPIGVPWTPPNGVPVQVPWTQPNGVPVPGPWTPPNGPAPGSPTRSYGTAGSTLRTLLGAPPDMPPASVAQQAAEYDATMQERLLWWAVRIMVIVFVLIALVLAAESV